VIVSFRSKGLRELFEDGHSRLVRPDLHARCLRCLDALRTARQLQDLGTPGLRCHPLQGFVPRRYAIKVNGPWRITFEWTENGAAQVDLEQYH
jgi:proteic killer suppression protein